MRNKWKTLIALFIAIQLTGIGVTLFIQANLGSDTITVFIDGLAKTLNITLGFASRIYNIIALIIAIVLSRKDIGWCTIVYALCVGYAMDFYQTIITFENPSFLAGLVLVLLGQLCFVLTYTILILYREGMNQMDAIAYGIARKSTKSYTFVRTFIDVMLLVIGYLLGGVVGIGSLITMLSTGFLVDKCVRILKPILVKESNTMGYVDI